MYIKKVFGLLLASTLLLSGVPGMSAYAASTPIVKTLGNSNPLMDYKLGADPYAIVYNGRVYIYLSSDDYEYKNGSIQDNSFSKLNRVRIMSSADMVNWTDHGEVPVAGANGLNGGKGIAKWAVGSWAPAAAHKVINGKDKFFLYFANTGNGIGVLTADTPIGPWSDPLGKALVTGSMPGMSGVTWLFDPAVLVDDDGTGYLYCGGGIPNDKDQTSIANPKTARVIKLGSDMISTVGSASTIDAPFMFEDSGIHKYNDKYYYSYCINFSGSHPSDKPAGEIGYMTSSSPMGPFTYAGHFLKNPGAFFGGGGNNHHTVFKFNNQWYAIYHTQTVSAALYGSGKGYRSPHINKLEYDASGNLKEVQGNLAGISQLVNLDPYKRVEAETIGWNARILTEQCQAAGGPTSNMDVTGIDNGDWIALGNVDFGTAGAKSVKANVASTVGGKIEIRLDKVDGTLIGTLDVSPTGGAQTWKTVETTVNNATGVHRLFFVLTGSGSNLFNFDYWQFTGEDSKPVTKNAFTKLEAEDYDSTNSTTIEKIGANDGGGIGYIENGNYIAFNNMDFGTGAKSFKATVASAGSPDIELRLNSPTGTLIGKLPVASTGDYITYNEQACDISTVTGVNDLYMVFSGAVNFDSFIFSNKSITPSLLSGDVNGDGKVNVVDATMLKSVVIKKNAESILKNKDAADMNSDGTINSIDYLLLKKAIQDKV